MNIDLGEPEVGTFYQRYGLSGVNSILDIDKVKISWLVGNCRGLKDEGYIVYYVPHGCMLTPKGEAMKSELIKAISKVPAPKEKTVYCFD